jgi:uncharacterized metal-binding protein
MTKQTERRHFLRAAGAGLAAGIAGVSGVQAAEPPSNVPLPDADTQAPEKGPQPVECVCDPASTLIFACSGAADTGCLSDLAARKLMKDGMGKMYCLAGVGGRVDPLMKGTASAETILAIEGCPMDCTRKTLELAGFKVTQHIRVTDLGLVKGQSPATEENVVKVVAAGKKALGK